MPKGIVQINFVGRHPWICFARSSSTKSQVRFVIFVENHIKIAVTLLDLVIFMGGMQGFTYGLFSAGGIKYGIVGGPIVNLKDSVM